MSTIWKRMLTHPPADGQSVWFHILTNEEPQKGTYDNLTRTFITDDGFVVPAYVVRNWKPR